MHQERRATYEFLPIPFARVGVPLGLTPNVLTAVELLLMAGAGTAFWQGHFFLGLILLLLASIADMLDGANVRAGGLGTVFG